MEIFPRLSFIILIFVLSLAQTNGVAGNLISTTAESPIEASICPNTSTISPCRCILDSFGIYVECYGSAVDQTSVENSFRELRRVNQIPEDRGVHIYAFRLQNTELTQFDLAPFYASRVDRLQIYDNFNLTKWVTSGQPQDHRSIHVDWFDFWNFPINGDGFGETLKYFSVQMTQFYVSGLTINPNNNNDEDEFQFEFLPELSAFVNLEYLGMVDCNISGHLNSSHFKAFAKLRTIDLRGNKIDVIGENVFSSNVLYISLQGNKLNETSFHPKSGIAQTGRPMTLDLQSNQITTLPSEIFETFLSAHSETYLYLRGNPLICDKRLSWIKSRRNEFYDQVPDADCVNDPGQSVFTSDLIP